MNAHPTAPFLLSRLASIAPAVVIELLAVPAEVASTWIRTVVDRSPDFGDAPEEAERAALWAAEQLATTLGHEPAEIIGETGVDLSPAQSDAWDAICASVISAGIAAAAVK